jgi:hypothetical protein
MNLFLLRVHKQAKLLCWHYQLGHLPFACLWILTLIKTIPKWLLKVKAPKMCWLYVQSNDQATLEDERNSKQKQDPSSSQPLLVTASCSINQLESPTPGFIAQFKGRLSKRDMEPPPFLLTMQATNREFPLM